VRNIVIAVSPAAAFGAVRLILHHFADFD